MLFLSLLEFSTFVESVDDIFIYRQQNPTFCIITHFYFVLCVYLRSPFFRRGMLHSWFTNHKAEFLFFEGWVDPHGCKKATDFLAPCNHGASTKHGARNVTKIKDKDAPHKEHTHHSKNDAIKRLRGSIISVADGYGYDIEKSEYCKVTSPSMLAHQVW
jgi:hypothetical protein